MRARSLFSSPASWLACRPLTALAVTAATLGVAACGWNPKRPFEREAPQVKEAVALLHDAGEAGAAASTLEDYLSTGPCADGNIGTPERVRQRPSGAFDLGLALFKIGEAYGRRFGQEEADGGADETLQKLRRANVDCALRVVRAMADGADGADGREHPTELRARAHYLEGNLNFLDGQYEEAVKAYDKAIALSPGQVDAGDPVGRDAAWNRAIALRRIEDKKDAGSDASSDGAADGSRDAAGEGGGGDSGQSPDSGKDDKDGGGNPPSSPDGGNDKDAASPPDKPDGGAPPSEPDGGSPPPPPPRANQDERILDQLEGAPTLQQEAAKNAAGKRRVRGMADK